MNKIHVLDCTLRDGGYCNSWEFKKENIHKIIKGLINANIDVIECGFLTDRERYSSDITKYNTVAEISEFIPSSRNDQTFVAMVNYGEYDVEQLPKYDGSSIDGIRVAFHKKDLSEALTLCHKIQDKGYKVFVQAMVSMAYSDMEFLELIEQVNLLNPYAFYIVDSFGMMKRKNLTRLFYMVENNLNENIWIGFHSHNNMQLAYSNAQALVDSHTNRNLLIDSSIYGMGRGAGNLNTELFLEYLNENVEGKYVLKPLFGVIDEVIIKFYQENYWGYSLPNYVSAAHWTHPNYAMYLSDKNSLTVQAMDEIFDMMDPDKRYEYDKSYIEELYLKYLNTGRRQEDNKIKLQDALLGREIVLVAPGKSSVNEIQKVREFISEGDKIVISVNFDYDLIETDYIFLSNMRRYRELATDKYAKCIVTSNIPADNMFLQTDYFSLLVDSEAVRDNAGLMAINYLVGMGVSSIYLVGFDGYSHNMADNYASKKLELFTRTSILEAMNSGMNDEILKFKKRVKIEFLTEPKYLK